MKKDEVGQEIETLLRSINMHFKGAGHDTPIPALELDLITAKIARLYEKFIIYKHLQQTEEKTPDNLSPVKEKQIEELRKQSFHVAPPAAETTIKKPAEKTPEESTPVKQSPPVVQSTPKPAVTGDVRKFMSINDRLLFQAQLFKGSADAFAKACERINSSSNFPDAIQQFTALQKELGWKNDDEPVLSFKFYIHKLFNA